MNSKYIKNKLEYSRGMTSIELIVVLMIFGVIASTVLFRFSSFSSNVALDNLAQDIALRVKQAQTNAISGQYPRLNTGDTDQTSPDLTWRPSYGVYFDKTGTNNKQFIFFFDRNSSALDGNKIIDDITPGVNCGIGDSECLDKITINTREYISDICIDTVCGTINNVAVVFTRPFPDANVVYNFVPGLGGSGTVATSDVKIKIKNDDTTISTKVITVTPLGQISVTNDSAGGTGVSGAEEMTTSGSAGEEL